MPRSFSGGCACGAIRYECSAEPLAMLSCHCRDCQRASGGGASSVIAVPATALALRGEPRWWSVSGEAGHVARRGFCPECGSPVLSASSRMPDVLVVKVASLDDPSWFRPMADIWTSSAQPWEPMDPVVPKFPKDLPPRPR